MLQQNTYSATKQQAKIIILGSTGSIGTSTLQVIADNRNLYQVEALVAHRNWQKLLQQAIEFSVPYIILIDPTKQQELLTAVAQAKFKPQVLIGLEQLIKLIQTTQAPIVMSAIVGIAGLLPTIAAIIAGKKILIANKESLVVAGDLCFTLAEQYQATIIPVDSEHNAMFQSLPIAIQQSLGKCDLNTAGIDHLILTGSGGPFRDLALAQFAQINKQQALNHPNWMMGAKITIDSATMMNKGLEYIEACVLYNCSPKQIKVVIHPQSIIHSMVSYIDGSVIAELGAPDMMTPISFALSYVNSDPQQPLRHKLNKQLDFTNLPALTFQPVDHERYPCFKLAIAAWEIGHHATTVLNAANEIVVELFLQDKINFIEIGELLTQFMTEQHFTLQENYYQLFQQQDKLLIIKQLNISEKHKQTLIHRLALDFQTRELLKTIPHIR